MPGRTSNARQSTAVMANRAPKTVEDLDPQRARWRALDFFPTPPWAARAGGELIRKLDPDARTLWEPACGQGHMSVPLRELGDARGAWWNVFASDIEDYGYGVKHDFLAPGEALLKPVDWIVTNPPFKLGAEFAERALEVADRGVALLLRLSFLETEGRHRLIFGPEGCSLVAVFCERVPMQLGSWDPKLSTATAYAWFIWMKPEARPLWWQGCGARHLSAIPPGTKGRLTLQTDASRFGLAASSPLFGAEG